MDLCVGRGYQKWTRNGSVSATESLATTAITLTACERAIYSNQNHSPSPTVASRSSVSQFLLRAVLPSVMGLHAVFEVAMLVREHLSPHFHEIICLHNALIWTRLHHSDSTDSRVALIAPSSFLLFLFPYGVPEQELDHFRRPAAKPLLTFTSSRHPPSPPTCSQLHSCNRKDRQS
ncbi:hypothetical protein F5I97DRAFT_312252 [Phlebopus sp. FC_14]|nr:hypothetical protein F5I97DRAFT_312252 [Phlebopus sp. FC_14]